VATKIFQGLRRLQSLVLCVLFQVTVPLLPLLVEKVITGVIGSQSINLAAGMYVIGLGLSAQNILVWSSGMVSGAFLAISLGVAPNHAATSAYPALPYWVGALMLMAFLFDRTYHHVFLGRGFAPLERD
jgi:hypothetical protein